MRGNPREEKSEKSNRKVMRREKKGKMIAE